MEAHEAALELLVLVAGALGFLAVSVRTAVARLYDLNCRRYCHQRQILRLSEGWECPEASAADHHVHAAAYRMSSSLKKRREKKNSTVVARRRWLVTAAPAGRC